jgi:thiol-disulfide isomerase/thioredoxin
MEFEYPIGYLEISDFDEQTGLLKGELSQKPVLVMIQASYCGACTKSKPEFQKLANNGMFNVMTIQLDGKKDTERQISNLLNKIIPGVNTIPAYVFFYKNNIFAYTGLSRTSLDLQQFVKTYLI